MQNEYIGGWEIIEYMKMLQSNESNYRFMNTSLMMQYTVYSVVKVLIVCLLLYACFKVSMLILNVGARGSYSAVDRELSSIHKFRRVSMRQDSFYDFIQAISELIRKTPLALSEAERTEMSYVLSRAGIRLPGRDSDITGDQYNAILRLCQLVGVLISIGVFISSGILAGVIMLVIVILGGNTIPNIIIDGMASSKDKEIEKEFFDFYINIHYALLSGSRESMSDIMKGYAKVTESSEMLRLIESCTYAFDTYGEYVGAQKMGEKYRELPLVSKLMRLIKQSNEGANIKVDLEGFREELLNKKVYGYQLESDKRVEKVRASMILLMPILIQAIISAALLYLGDMGAISSFF